MSAKSFSLDHLTDTQFEEFCFDLLGELRFVNIKWRKGTGLSTSPSDRGRDIECQLECTDVDGHKYFETWFVECKHSVKGVSPDKIQGALAWAAAERPDKLLLIASNFLSNPTHDFIDSYEKNNHPPFKIKKWERTELERLTAGNARLLRKYSVSDELPFLSIMHPAHLLYISGLRFNSLESLFNLLDRLEPKKRDRILDWAYFFIIRPRFREPVTGKESYRERLIDEISYVAFKQRCLRLAPHMEGILLASTIVNFTLQGMFGLADKTSSRLKGFSSQLQKLEGMRRAYRGETDEHKDALKIVIDELKKKEPDFREERVEQFFNRMTNFLEGRIRDYPNELKENYELYVYFCEHVVKELLIEDALT